MESLVERMSTLCDENKEKIDIHQIRIRFTRRPKKQSNNNLKMMLKQETKKSSSVAPTKITQEKKVCVQGQCLFEK
jgi:hypothetical protein